MSEQVKPPLIPTERVFPDGQTSAQNGRIRISWSKALWVLGNALGGIVGLVCFSGLDTFIVFLMLTGLTICAGHSVGMHRLLIHRSFKTHVAFEYVLVWLGTLVGMAGPFGMIRAHDMRDWHQRQVVCPPHPAHGAGLFKDAFWQLCCVFDLDNPPKFVIEPDVQNDPVYRVMERTWMAQQIFLAVPLFLLGGWGWILWGCCLRVFVSLLGHWLIGHFAHRSGDQDWIVEGVPVQGYNLPHLGLISFGENWHGNHHAFPHSAKLGLEQGQLDPGYIMITHLEKLGAAWDIKLPASEPQRAGLVRASKHPVG
jgi:stearoyl-CoA desaturase (delta-9 desaturase)